MEIEDKQVFQIFDKPSSFIDRKLELDKLALELIQLETRVALISGSAGIGKTALAFHFARKYKEHFSGGIFGISPIPASSLSEKALNTISTAEKESLLIINDAEQLPDAVVERELGNILYSRPKTRIIITSRKQMFFESISVPIIALTPFSPDAYKDYCRLFLDIELSPVFRQKLFERLQGNPLLTAISATAIQEGLYTAPELLESLEPFIKEGVLGPNGRPLRPESKSYKHIISDVREVSDGLLEKLAKDPKLLYELSPRLFEQVVSEMLSRMGYEVTLTPASRDGGKDVYAASRNHLGSFLYIVECKKYSPDNFVGVSLVRQLYGVVQAEKATAGILATTSFFTKGAKEFQGQVAFQISLQDFLGIQKWLQSVQHRDGKLKVI